MKKTLAPLLCALICLLACSYKQFPQSGTSIKPDQLETITAKKNVILIDVRTESEFKEGHIPGAQLMDVMQEANFLQQIKSLNPNKAYVVYCRSGRRSKKAMELMQQNGFKQVVDLEGGIQAWTGPKVIQTRD